MALATEVTWMEDLPPAQAATNENPTTKAGIPATRINLIGLPERA